MHHTFNIDMELLDHRQGVVVQEEEEEEEEEVEKCFEAAIEVAFAVVVFCELMNREP